MGPLAPLVPMSLMHAESMPGVVSLFFNGKNRNFQNTRSSGCAMPTNDPELFTIFLGLFVDSHLTWSLHKRLGLVG